MRLVPQYSRSLKVGNPIASILKSNVSGIPALFGLNPVSNFKGFTVETRRAWGVWEFGVQGLRVSGLVFGVWV